MIQLALRHLREHVLGGLMTRLGVNLQIVHRDQSLEFHCACLFFRAGAVCRLRSESSPLGGVRQDLFLTVYVNDQLARRPHTRLGAEIEV
jgi:hypothetical protein